MFVPFFEEFVLTASGDYEKIDNVRSFAENYEVPLKEIGITEYKWIDDSIKKDLHRHKIDVGRIDFSTLLSDAEPLKLAEWINNLSANDYSEFNKLSNAHKNERGVQEVKIFRSNKGNLFSYSELNSKANIYFPLEEGMKFGECEHINEILSDINQPVYIANLFDKIKTNIASFRLSDSTKEDAANLLAWIATKEQHYTYKIKTEIFLLQDWHDSYKPFNSLLEERPKDTILFDKYCVKGFIPEAVRKNSWLLNPSKAKTTFWEWVKSNWANLKEDEGWSENTHKYISDIKSAFKAVDTKSQDQIDTKTLTLFLDKEGKPTTQLRAIVNNVSKLTEDEYNYLEANVAHLRLLPYEFCKELMEAPFRVETVQSANIVNEKIGRAHV